MSKETSSPSKMISLKAADDIIFEVEPTIAMKMQTVKNFIDESNDIATIPLPKVFGKHLAMIIEFCKNQGAKETIDAKKKFEADFVKRLSDVAVKELILAANYLNISSLINFLIPVIADRIKDMSVESVREYLGIENDFRHEEEVKLRRECEWAYKGIDKDEN